MLYQGKVKKLYATDDPNNLIVEHSDIATAFNGEKAEAFKHKGTINNYFNAFIMSYLAERGIQTHFEKIIGSNQSLVKHLDMFPIECVIRNYAAGSICKRLGLTEGKKFALPVFEFYLKSDELGDPLITDSHVFALGLATKSDLTTLREETIKINELLLPLFDKAGFLLIDFKLEFGRYDNHIYLGDEFTLDGCRLWDARDLKKYDKDRFRQNLGDLIPAYQEAAERIGVAIPEIA